MNKKDYLQFLRFCLAFPVIIKIILQIVLIVKGHPKLFLCIIPVQFCETSWIVLGKVKPIERE